MTRASKAKPEKPARPRKTKPAPYAVPHGHVFGTATAGYRGTATAGYRGTATAGAGGTTTAGDYGTATAGDYGTATAGEGGTATAGYRGTATAGEGGSISIRWWDGDASRWRLRSGDVGAKETLKPGVKYRLNDRGEFEEAK